MFHCRLMKEERVSKQHENSAKEFIHSLSLGDGNPALLYGNFIDDFNRADKQQKQGMLLEEPESFPNVRDIDYVNIAATVHKLANDSGTPVPEWVFKDRYYAKEPYFPSKHPELRLIYMYESPTEFKHRNMFVSANAMQRV